MSGTLEGDRQRLSALARRGSGSAARSLWGGFVRLDRGMRADGEDCRARPLLPATHWDLQLLIVHTARGPKSLGSTDGMIRSEQTSPYYKAWVDSSEADLDRAEHALTARDLTTLGEVMEHSCFKMHACMLASRPPILYWNGTTLEVIRALWAARADGLMGYATSDAGPHVKVLCQTNDANALQERLGQVRGVEQIERVGPGPDARVEWIDDGESSS
jgi:diphosphomevalonate decarboxylase